MTLECGNELPVMTLACKNEKGLTCEDNLPVYEGYVGDFRVNVLRDTGCSNVVVRRDLVLKDGLTGASKYCVLLNGAVRNFPVVNIHIRSPFFIGDCEALCAENPVFDLILGNIDCVRNPSDPNLNWEDTESVRGLEVANAVQTRPQKANEGKITSLKVPRAVSSIDVNEVRKSQQTDETLKSAREQLSTGEKKLAKNSAVHWYEKHNGVTYRMFQAPHVEKNKLYKQCLSHQI